MIPAIRTKFWSIVKKNEIITIAYAGHSWKEHHKMSKVAKFGCELL
jgi:hypothetical protein